MTYKEATTIAMRELGIGEEEIQKRLAWASLKTLGYPGAENATVKKGHERDMVEAIKETHLYAMDHPQEVIEAIGICEKKMEKLSQLN